MKLLTSLFTLLFLALLAVPHLRADGPCSDTSSVPSSFNYNNSACKKVTNFTATPLIDGSPTTFYLQDMLNQQTVSLYGIYGNTESPNTHAEATQHYSQGITLASQIMPRCADGTLPGSNGCDDNSSPKIVFLFIGFSNCDVEICGGHADAWDITRTQLMEPPLAGQACATQCPNLHNPNFQYAWNKAFYLDSTGQLQWDGYDQMSLLRQVYPDSTNTQNWLVGPDVVVFDGALGGQTLEKWDPTSIGYYSNPNNTCDYNQFTTHDPECNYTRVQSALTLNGYTEAQVQAVFIKSGDSFPTCDLSTTYCNPGDTPDAYQAETYLGDVLRYLKCCKQPPPGSGLPSLPRYPNVKQVFLTSRIYGGYANGSIGGANACLNPEPFAYVPVAKLG